MGIILLRDITLRWPEKEKTFSPIVDKIWSFFGSKLDINTVNRIQAVAYSNIKILSALQMEIVELKDTHALEALKSNDFSKTAEDLSKVESSIADHLQFFELCIQYSTWSLAISP